MINRIYPDETVTITNMQLFGRIEYYRWLGLVKLSSLLRDRASRCWPAGGTLVAVVDDRTEASWDMSMTSSAQRYLAPFCCCFAVAAFAVVVFSLSCFDDGVAA